VDQRKNLRERVARLETLLDSLLEELNDRKSGLNIKDLGDSHLGPAEQNDEKSQLPRPGRAPIWTLLDNSVWAASDDQKTQRTIETGVTNVSGPQDHDTFENTCAQQLGSSSQKKNERVSQILKNALPSQEVLLDVLNANSEMWTKMTTMMVGSGTPKELTSIHAYAAYAMSNKGTPMDLAKILQFVAGKSSDDDIERLLNLIERLIIHDDEYMGTLSGVEVALHQCRLYSDIGQARRAWLTTRRALDFAQLMGLHRTRVNLRQDILFWGIFQNDRFCSLLLGTPYGIPDVHCNLTFGGTDQLTVATNHGFLTRLAIFAGRVVERTHGNQEPSFSSLLTIDNDLTRFGNQMPPEFWTLEPQAPKDNYMEWLQKAVGQQLYHQTRLILHIPYMLKSVSNGGFEYSRDTCFSSARDIIDVFLIMRDECNSFVYKAKFADFICFMALVTLIIGLVSANQQVQSDMEGAKANPQANPKQQVEDWKRVDACIDTYRRISDQPFGKVARQSYRALQQLTKFRNCNAQKDEDGVKVVVPFFGTITLKFPIKERDAEKKQKPANNASNMNNQNTSPINSNSSRNQSPLSGHLPSPHSPSNGMPTMAHTQHGVHHASASQHAPQYPLSNPMAPLHASPVSPVNQNGQFEARIMYDGVYAPNAGYGGPPFVTAGSAGLSCHIPTAHLPPSYGWQNVGTFDIDQDWDWDAGNPLQGSIG